MAGRWHDEGVESMFGCYFEGDAPPELVSGPLHGAHDPARVTVVLSGLTEPSSGG